MTTYRVMKFGGSSVGSPERLGQVLRIIRRERAQGPVAVVVSAMGDTTDWLLDAVDAAARGAREEAEVIVDRIAELALANGRAHDGADIEALVAGRIAPLRELLHGVSLVRERTPQTVDQVLSFGEQISASVVARLLGSGGVYVDARDWTVTDDRFGHALVDWPATQRQLDAERSTWGERVPVHTGFLGRTPDGRTTTLGRNGSDYTATLLARGLGAARVDIWTDVSGVMTADPALVHDAYPIARLSYMEALELANFGARMFHPRTMIPLIESGIPMRIRNTMAPDAPGTRVDATGAPDPDHPTSITSLESLALVGLQWRRITHKANLAERVMRALEVADVPVWMFTQAAHGQALAFVVPHDAVEAVRAAVDAELGAEAARGERLPLEVRAPVTLLTLVAEAMGRTVNVAGRLFHTLGAVGINIRAIAQGASSRSVSCIIDAADTPLAVRTAHATFNLAHQEVNLFVLGTGTVGGELLDQIREQAAALERDHDVRLRVAGVADSHGWRFDEGGLPADARPEPVDAPWPIDEGHPLLHVLDRLRRLPVPILVDCTAARHMDRLYRAAFERGVHVVAANKKPLTAEQGTWRALAESARRHSRFFHYETSCGAALPIIATLQSLVRTGDRIRRVEGLLSGTLGYLAGELMAGVPLSQAVRAARAQGFTEPHPAEDLSGTDVARKALILARELGLSLELADVEVQPFVANSVLDAPDLEAFFAALEAHDANMSARIEALKADGRVLRYLAVIDPAADPVMRVGPVEVPADHPATRLRGADAFVAFHTERYTGHPLIVQGAGAGGTITAAGVLTDVLRVAQTVRGR